MWVLVLVVPARRTYVMHNRDEEYILECKNIGIYKDGHTTSGIIALHCCRHVGLPVDPQKSSARWCGKTL